MSVKIKKRLPESLVTSARRLYSSSNWFLLPFSKVQKTIWFLVFMISALVFLCLFKRKINERRFSRTDWRINFSPLCHVVFLKKSWKQIRLKISRPLLSVCIQTDSRRTSNLAAAAFQLPSDISCNTFLLRGMQHQEIDYKYLITKKSERARGWPWETGLIATIPFPTTPGAPNFPPLDSSLYDRYDCM